MIELLRKERRVRRMWKTVEKEGRYLTLVMTGVQTRRLAFAGPSWSRCRAQLHLIKNKPTTAITTAKAGRSTMTREHIAITSRRCSLGVFKK
jgi:hypothetical protein